MMRAPERRLPESWPRTITRPSKGETSSDLENLGLIERWRTRVGTTLRSVSLLPWTDFWLTALVVFRRAAITHKVSNGFMRRFWPGQSPRDKSKSYRSTAGRSYAHIGGFCALAQPFHLQGL